MRNGTENDGMRMKEFLLAMSHEIRTPLSVIIGMCDIAGKHIDDRARLASCLDKIDAAAAHITELVDMVLDITGTGGRDVLAEHREFSVEELTCELRDMLEPLADDKGINLSVSDEEVVHRDVSGDYGGILLIMMNLGTNAVKYTRNGGRVEIKTSEAEMTEDGDVVYRFLCRDNGMGMSEEFMKRIFEPFARSDAARAGGESGSGLGMSIVKKTVDELGGNIDIKSREGAGTEVTVDIRLKCVETFDGMWYNNPNI